MKAIQISNLNKSYEKKKVLDNLTLNIDKPGVYLIAGPNGSGKTTLLEILVGLRNYDSGTVLIKDKKVGDLAVKKSVGFLIQQNTLRKNSTVEEELNLIKEIFNLDIDTYEYLKKYNLEDYYKKKTRQLSGGTKRRVLIAMLFMPQYDIIILDEPVSGLDTFSRDEIWSMIREYSKDKIIVVSDHYLNQAAQYSDYIYLINRGHIALEGTTDKILSDFSMEYVIKTRRTHYNNVEEILKKHCNRFEVKVSGSVYNLFIDKNNQNVLDHMKSNSTYSVHPIDFEDIYFYHTGDIFHPQEELQWAE